MADDHDAAAAGCRIPIRRRPASTAAAATTTGVGCSGNALAGEITAAATTADAAHAGFCAAVGRFAAATATAIVFLLACNRTGNTHATVSAGHIPASVSTNCARTTTTTTGIAVAGYSIAACAPCIAIAACSPCCPGGTRTSGS